MEPIFETLCFSRVVTAVSPSALKLAIVEAPRVLGAACRGLYYTSTRE